MLRNAHWQRLLLAVVIVCLLGAIFSAGFVLAQGSPTPSPTPPANYVLPDDMYVRSGPDREYIAIGRLLRGDQIIPVSISEDGDWIMIRYSWGFGWVLRNLVEWSDNVDALPELAADITPTFSPEDYTPTPFFATNTPDGNWANVDEQGAYLRAGPGRTYLVMGALQRGDLVEPVARTEDFTWVMVRIDDDFAWVLNDLINWQDDVAALPIVDTADTANLTPSATFTPTFTSTPSSTPSDTPTYTPTPTDTSTPTSTSTATATDLPTVTATNTPLPTYTSTAVPTETPLPTETLPPTNTDIPPSDTPQPTDTLAPTVTLVPSDTPAPTATPVPTNTASPVPTDTLAPTDTAIPTNTVTPSDTPAPTDTLTSTDTEIPPSDTPQPTETLAPTETPAPTATALPTQVVAVVPTETPIPASDTPSPTETLPPTATPVPTDTDVPPTETAIPASDTPPPSATTAPTETQSPTDTLAPTAIAVVPVEPTASTAVQDTPPPDDTAPPGIDLSRETIIGGIIVALIAAYILAYAIGAANVNRYPAGFVIETCPVCQKGELNVVNRQRRFLGIPRVRRTVHCDYCGSVLRQVRRFRWRYTVDAEENLDLYQRYNGRQITDAELRQIGESLRYQMVPNNGVSDVPPEGFEPPEYIDE